MRPIKVLLSLIIVVAVLFASTLSVGAIGFEAEKAYESVFVIYSGNSLGSGFAVGENCIVTNAHVIDNPRSITVETYGGTKYKASVLGMNEQQDIAVLIVKDATFPYLDIADLTTMKTGDDIYAIGAPKGMAYTLTKGGVSAKERMIGNQTYIQIDAAINEGNSGGPLLNNDGQVLGMNTMKMTDSEGIGLAIPVSRICAYLTELGIQLDEAGNVVQPVQPEELPEDSRETEAPEQETVKKDPGKKKTAPDTTVLAWSVAGASLALNVLLGILLAQKKRRNVPAPYSPSDRTDFEIDILE